MSAFIVFYQSTKEVRAVNRLGNIVSGYVFYNMAASVICVEKPFVQPLKSQQLNHVIDSCGICHLAKHQVAEF